MSVCELQQLDSVLAFCRAAEAEKSRLDYVMSHKKEKKRDKNHKDEDKKNSLKVIETCLRATERNPVM